MTRTKIPAYFAASAAAVLCVALFLRAAKTTQEGQSSNHKHHNTVQLIPSLEGGELFHAYCATCHGVTGKGDGPIASVLDTKVADLTTIAQRNGGIFPAERVRKIIAGDELIKAHGTREMPIWGPIFHQIERDRDYGNIRLENVTKFVQSLQGK